MTTPAELLLQRAAPWLVGGSAVALPLLLLGEPTDLLAASTLHLSGVVAVGFGLGLVVAPLADGRWFEGSSWRPAARSYAAAAAVVIVVTGTVGLITLATGAALRFDPSLQFLQLISALDIAWVVTTGMIGARRGWGAGAGAVAGAIIAVACVFSIYRYLDIVGFATDGGWLVDGGEIVRLILPFDMVAAAVAVTLLVAGTQRTTQASPKS